MFAMKISSNEKVTLCSNKLDQTISKLSDLTKLKSTFLCIKLPLPNDLKQWFLKLGSGTHYWSKHQARGLKIYRNSIIKKETVNSVFILNHFKNTKTVLTKGKKNVFCCLLQLTKDMVTSLCHFCFIGPSERFGSH